MYRRLALQLEKKKQTHHAINLLIKILSITQAHKELAHKHTIHSRPSAVFFSSLKFTLSRSHTHSLTLVCRCRLFSSITHRTIQSHKSREIQRYFFLSVLVVPSNSLISPEKRSKKRAMCNRNHWPTVIESKATKLYKKSDRL